MYAARGGAGADGGGAERPSALPSCLLDVRRTGYSTAEARAYSYVHREKLGGVAWRDFRLSFRARSGCQLDLRL